MDTAKLRAWRFHRQGLDGSFRGLSCREALARAGWARSVGGAHPYLALFARTGAGREEIDRAVANLEIHELPAARGCTYVVACDDFQTALGVSRGFAEAAELNTAKKFLGVTDAEVEQLRIAVLGHLMRAAADPMELRKALGDAVRSLGDEGKKRGQTTTLPLALGSLQVEGKIRRIPVNGRIDQQRYRYAAWVDGPQPNRDSEAGRARLAELFWQWSGAATFDQFKSFSGFTVASAKAAVEPLALEPIEPGSELLATSEDKSTLDAFVVPSNPSYTLVGSMDSYLLPRRDAATTIDEADVEVRLYTEGGEKLGTSLSELSCNAILDRGRLVGVWEYDPDSRELVWSTFGGGPDSDLIRTIALMEAFIREDLEDCRSFSLDSPAARKPKLAWIRSQR